MQLINSSLQNYSSAIFTEGKVDYYFDNIFSAIKTAHSLNKSHNGRLAYNVFKVPRDCEKKIAIDKIVSSYDEYRTITKRRTQELLEELEKLNGSEPTM